MRLLIEGGSYSRAAFIYFRPILDRVVHEDCSTEDWFTKIALREVDIQPSKKLIRCSRTKLRLSSAMVCPERASARSTYDRDHTHLIGFAHACGYYSRAAFTELQVRLLFDVRLLFNKYGSAFWYAPVPPLP